MTMALIKRDQQTLAGREGIARNQRQDYEVGLDASWATDREQRKEVTMNTCTEHYTPAQCAQAGCDGQGHIGSRDMFGNDLTKGDSFGTARDAPATVPVGEHETVTTCGQCRVLRHRESEPARVEFCSRHVAIVNSFAAMREALRKVLAEYDGPNSNCLLGSFYADEVLPKCSDETAEIVRAALAASGGGK